MKNTSLLGEVNIIRGKLASYCKGQGDNGTILESLLWDDSVIKAVKGNWAVWVSKYMFSSLRSGRQFKKMKISPDKDLVIQTKKKD